MPLDRLDDSIAKRFAAALGRLEKSGCRLSDETLPLLAELAEINAKGGILPAEAFAVHRDRLARRGDAIDPNVRVRLERAAKIPAHDYIDMTRARAVLVRAMDARLADLDLLAMPTTPITAPLMSEVAAPDEFARRNALLLRNTTLWNFFDCCAISLPLPRDGGLPAGLMLVARNGHDHRLLRIAAAVERLLA
jgi:aspartyl-tRNA(Asn)/glutamyl-tRNA(Gln) amidotransferase subunit A